MIQNENREEEEHSPITDGWIQRGKEEGVGDGGMEEGRGGGRVERELFGEGHMEKECGGDLKRKTEREKVVKIVYMI